MSDLEIMKDSSGNGNSEHYKFKIRNTVYEADKPELTSREICQIAGLDPPENYKLDMKLQGNIYKEVGLNDIVDITVSQFEKFEYIERNQTEG